MAGSQPDPREVHAVLDRDIDAAARIDPTALYRRATERRAFYDAVNAELEQLRGEALVRLNADGLSYRAIAAHVGLSTARVDQLIKRTRSEMT